MRKSTGEDQHKFPVLRNDNYLSYNFLMIELYSSLSVKVIHLENSPLKPHIVL